MRFGSVRSGVGTEDERNAVGALAVLIGVDGSTANRRSTSASSAMYRAGSPPMSGWCSRATARRAALYAAARSCAECSFTWSDSHNSDPHDILDCDVHGPVDHRRDSAAHCLGGLDRKSVV